MENALEAYAQKVWEFEDQFLANASEGTHWYLGDSFSSLKLLENCLISGGINYCFNPHLEGEPNEYSIDLTAHEKVIYRLPLTDFSTTTIIKKFDSDLLVIQFYGLPNEVALAFRRSIQEILEKFNQDQAPL